jgi:hypothetical protein
MSPESYPRLGIIGREIGSTSIDIDISKYLIGELIREDTIPTVLDPIELSLHVKSESILIMHPLSL